MRSIGCGCASVQLVYPNSAVYVWRVLSAVLFILTMQAGATQAQETTKPLSNSDIANLVKAGLPESTIVLTIRAGPTAFDTSANGLIALKKSNVPTGVIEAMLQANSARTLPSTSQSTSAQMRQRPSASAEAQEKRLPVWSAAEAKGAIDRVLLIDGDKHIEMRYIKPGIRSRYAFVGQSFAVLQGRSATLRAGSNTPEFEMIFPRNVDAISLVVVGHLAVRDNNTREVMVSSGMSSGLPAERSVRLVAQKSSDQSGAPEGYEVHRIRPASALARGEYAFMVHKPGQGAVNNLGVTSSLEHNYYEFGVD